MHLGHAWLGRIATIAADDAIAVDAAKLLRHLLLFDRVIIQSIRLREFNVLAGKLGALGLSALLRSGAIRVHCHALTTAQTGQSDVGGRTTPLPLSAYSFQLVDHADRKRYLHDCFENVRPGSDLSWRESKRLKHDIADRLLDPVDTVRREMESQFQFDLRSSAPYFSAALAIELERKHAISLAPSDLKLRIHELNEGDFHVESNLALLTSLDDGERHKAMEHALLAVSGMNQRLAEMNGYGALTDFWDRDLPVLESKVRYLSGLAPERHDRDLATILALPGLPDLAVSLEQGRVDMERFLEIRDSPDGQQFRRWFTGRANEDIAELSDQWSKVRSRVGGWLATTPGKTMRLFVSTGLGVLPGVGLVAGAIDNFLLDKWLPRFQPLTFLRHSYTSIFRDQGIGGSR